MVAVDSNGVVRTRGGRRKNYIIDTNVLLHDPDCLSNFKDNDLFLPIIVLEELDQLKTREGLTGYQARGAARALSTLFGKADVRSGFTKGVSLGDGILLRVLHHGDEIEHTDLFLDLNKNDNRILATALRVMREHPEHNTILVSKDICMRIKAEALGITAEDYETDRTQVENLYKGYQELELSSQEIDLIFEDSGLPPPKKREFYPNEFVHAVSKENPSHSVLARFNGKVLVPLRYTNHEAWGLRPINMEQKMAFELLMDPGVPFVTLTGGAGSGKTILATAVALEKVLEQKEYRRIVFVRPTIAAGNDIGYLPGSEEEKLRPWMGSFYDAIDMLMRSDPVTKIRGRTRKESDGFQVDAFIEDLRDAGTIETKTFTYMRGRTLSDAIVIVDEAQEITPHLAKLMLTRAGMNSKFVFLGDPSDNQIDNLMVDSRSNGLVYVIDKMKECDITGHVTLRQVERSKLARLAERCM
jgi:PhoH-like ATPase